MANLQEQLIKYLDIKSLCRQIEKNFETFITRQPENEQMKKIIGILKKYKDSSTSGNIEDRNILKAHIKTDLLTSFDIYKEFEDGRLDDVVLHTNIRIDQNNGYLDYVLPFESPGNLTVSEKFCIILYLNSNSYDNGRSEAFKQLLSKYPIYEKSRADSSGSWQYKSNRYEYNSEDIDYIYLQETKNKRVNFGDKLEIIVQLIYESLFGLKCLDTLAYSDVNEVGFSNDGKYIYCWCDIKIWLSFLELSK